MARHSKRIRDDSPHTERMTPTRVKAPQPPRVFGPPGVEQIQLETEATPTRSTTGRPSTAGRPTRGATRSAKKARATPRASTRAAPKPKRERSEEHDNVPKRRKLTTK